MQLWRTGALVCIVATAAVVASCAQENYPLALWEAQHPPPPKGTVVQSAIVCTQTHAEPLPARLVAMSSSAGTSGGVVFVSDIFQQFVQVCGSCHGPAVDPPGQGGFQITTAGDFSAAMTKLAYPAPSGSVIGHVTMAVCATPPLPENSSNPADPMPPCGTATGATYATRSDTDPVKQFAELVQEWLAAGSPVSFTPGGGSDAGAPNPYALTPHNGNVMTNIGNCVPNQLAADEQAMASLDAKFAGAVAKSSGTAAEVIGLPEHLSETDLVTFDSEELARYRVIAYAPGYPLWSDNAGKLRHVRVPLGQSIHFDKAKQQFAIPPNTRFYKTFMKQIVDTDGSYRYRKIETRLIVARPDKNNPDGTAAQQTALFGSYHWNDAESDATLVETPLNSAQPFADTLFLYNSDEQLAADLLRGQPSDPEIALLNGGAARHYAIPGSPRCMQCHMGSPSQDFVLGFTPLQINRRPTGVGGVIEATGPDELTQLQRFIDAGVITGIDSPADILPLELSEGSRRPRNDYELVAQGYMMGNCQHCHNPRGFPSVQNPVLQNVLDFLPGPDGGIFQFPLERYSPRIGRGLSGAEPIPYVTPSLVDLPRKDPGTLQQAGDPFVAGTGIGGNLPSSVVYAPWRSIIYRNADSAFAYVDDLALYPHMPMNTPGYDPRAKQILSDWMVSIPARRKHPELPEYSYQTDGNQGDNVPGGAPVDISPQPYVDVCPTDANYPQAVAEAEQRLSVLHSGVNPAVPLDPSHGVIYSRYLDPGLTDDVLDPSVVANPVCNPVPVGEPTAPYPFPRHPHWVITDLTNPPQQKDSWAPRQPNWNTVLVNNKPPPPNQSCSAVSGQDAAYADQIVAIDLLQSATLADVNDFATTPLPFGLWQQKPGCTFAGVHTAGSYTGMSRPHWMDVSPAAPADAPVYSQTPGEAIFKMICINCHGPRADSNGRLAQNLATMSGGLARVADFRDGLFGPPGATEDQSDIHWAFGPQNLPSGASASWTQVTDYDRAARYMGWMGLGGTSVHIPVELLEIVAVTKVLDAQRVVSATSLSANMLSQAKALCLSLLTPSATDFNNQGEYFDAEPGHGYLDAKETHLNDSLIPTNGDAEMWIRLCGLANKPPVHVLLPFPGRPGPAAKTLLGTDGVLNLPQYGADVLISQDNFAAMCGSSPCPVGNETGAVDSSLQDSNLWPWCVDDSGGSADVEPWLGTEKLAICPTALKTARAACEHGGSCTQFYGNDDANRWAVRGAINAGFSVFLYVKSIENTTPPLDYNQCDGTTTTGAAPGGYGMCGPP